MRIDRGEVEPGRRYAWVWTGALATFIVAALTGGLYRYAIVSGETFGLSLTNIRHAHSHLMYFGWATPVLIAGIAILKPEMFDARRLRAILIAVFIAAAASYPMFLIFGYEVHSIGPARMPLAVVVSGLNMIAWYMFVALYVRSTRGKTRDRSLLLFDLSLTFLVLATLGAWMLAALGPFGIESDVWTSALTHIFLDLFSEGWFVLGLLALMYGVADGVWPKGHWSLGLICAGLPVTFALGMPRSLVPNSLAVMASIGSLLVGLGLLINVFLLWNHRPRGLNRLLWQLPLALLGLKSIAQIALLLLPGLWLTSVAGLRIIYLHLMLLGFLSIGLTAVARVLFGYRQTVGAYALAAAALLLIASLIPLSAVFPSSWSGWWVFLLAAIIAPLPPLVALFMMIFGIRNRSILRKENVNQSDRRGYEDRAGVMSNVMVKEELADAPPVH